MEATSTAPTSHRSSRARSVQARIWASCVLVTFNPRLVSNRSTASAFPSIFPSILARRNERVRNALEALNMQSYEYQSEFARKYYGQGTIEGKIRCPKPRSMGCLAQTAVCSSRHSTSSTASHASRACCPTTYTGQRTGGGSPPER